jgi:hypothetical protein
MTLRKEIISFCLCLFIGINSVSARILYEIPQGSPLIDGNIFTTTEWDGAYVIPISYPEITQSPNEGSLWIGTGVQHDDYVATVLLKWDISYLYMAIYVIDDQLSFTDASGGALNSQDSLQLCFNYLDNLSAVIVEDAPIYDIAAETAGSNGPEVYSHASTTFILNSSTVASNVKPYGYVIEAALPWSELSGSASYTPATGDIHGFGILALDEDETGSVDNALADHGLDNTHMFDVSYWNQIKLVSSSTVENVTVAVNSTYPISSTPALGSYSYPKYVWEYFIGDNYQDCPDSYEFIGWNINGVDDTEVPLIYRLNSNTTLNAIFEVSSECGDACHPYPMTDLTSDCVVDFNDLYIFVNNWLFNNL